jgi:hypothetical protein
VGGQDEGSLRTLAPQFSATRMLADLERLMYANGLAARA